jgi:hypothetical protein
MGSVHQLSVIDLDDFAGQVAGCWRNEVKDGSNAFLGGTSALERRGTVKARFNDTRADPVDTDAV